MNLGQADGISCPKCGSFSPKLSQGQYHCYSCGIDFNLASSIGIPAAKEERPRRVFISFGAPDREICRRICQTLQERGYDAWFDEERIAPGEDWRERITEGMKNSDMALIFYSQYSVNESYVCKQELSMALRFLEGNILPVRMEKDAQPPPQLKRLQWLDMSKRSELMRIDPKGTEVFEPWFRGRMDELCKLLDSGERREAAQERRIIRERLGVREDTGKQDELLANGLVGREWMFARVDAWLNDPEGQSLCVLYGDPGVGKSAFVAHLMEAKPDKVLAGVFCESNREAESSPAMVIKTLAYLLARNLPDYRSALASLLRTESRLDSLSPSDLFFRLLAEPLKELTIPENNGTQCIVIDGLDESARRNPEDRLEFARLLADGAKRLPAWLRVLVASQDLTELHSSLSSARQLRLDGTGAENQEDMRRYLEERLGERFRENPAWDEAIRVLTERSGGIFLYARLVSQSILDGQLSIEDTEEFPDGLAAAFDRWFSGYFPNAREYKEKYRTPLGMLLASPEPLPTDELRKLNDWDENETEDFLFRIAPLLRRGLNVFQKETVSLSHEYLRQWLDSVDSGEFHTSVSGAYRKMANWYLKQFRSEPEDLSEYAALHLAEFAKREGKRTDWDDVMSSMETLLKLMEAGDGSIIWGDWDTALNYYERAKDMTVFMTKRRKDMSAYGYFLECHKRLKFILHMSGEAEKLRLLEEEFQEYQTLRKFPILPPSAAPEEPPVSIPNSESDESAVFQKPGVSFEQFALKSDDLNLLRAFVTNLYDTANSLYESGKLERALEYAKKSIAIAERLATLSEKPNDRRLLGYTYFVAGSILNSMGKLAQAHEFLQKSLLVCEQVAKKNGTPENRILFVSLIIALGRITQTMGKPEEGLALLHKARSIVEQMVRKWKQAPNIQFLLSQSYIFLSDNLLETDRLREASQWLQKAFPIAESLVKTRRTPNDWALLDDCYLQKGCVLAATDKLSEALEQCQKALALSEQVFQKQGTLNNRKSLSSDHYWLAETMAQSDTDGAREHYQTALTLMATVIQERGSPDDQRDAAACRHRLADLQWDAGEISDAQETYVGIREVYAEVAKIRDAPIDWQYLCVSENNLAAVLEEKGDFQGALDAYRRDLSVAETLVARWNAPADMESLAVSCWNIAQLERAPLEERLSCARKGLNLAQTLRDGAQDGDYVALYQELAEDFQALLIKLENG